MAADILTGLQLYLKCNETAGVSLADSSGFARNAALTYTAGQITFVAGKIGGGVSLNNDAALIQVAHNVALGGSPLSAFTWVKPSTLPALGTILSKENSGDSFKGYYLRMDGSAVALTAVVSIGGSFITATGPAVPSGSFSHVGFTHDGSLLTAWVNGVAGTPVAAVGTIDQEAVPFQVGGDFVTPTRTVQGVYDEVRIYSRGLAAIDVAALFAFSGNAHRQQSSLAGLGLPF